MFSASPDTTLACPRCRHVSMVGNSVNGLKKNYAVLALLHSPSSSAAPFDYDYTDEEEDDDGGVNEEDWCIHGSHASISQNGGCGLVIEVLAHQEVKLVRKIELSKFPFNLTLLHNSNCRDLVQKDAQNNLSTVMSRSRPKENWHLSKFDAMPDPRNTFRIAATLFLVIMFTPWKKGLQACSSPLCLTIKGHGHKTYPRHRAMFVAEQSEQPCQPLPYVSYLSY